jgi:hypothetical protein
MEYDHIRWGSLNGDVEDDSVKLDRSRNESMSSSKEEKIYVGIRESLLIKNGKGGR